MEETEQKLRLSESRSKYYKNCMRINLRKRVGRRKNRTGNNKKKKIEGNRRYEHWIHLLKAENEQPKNVLRRTFKS